jgi:succinoglycan biosynthesis protein ExoM
VPHPATVDVCICTYRRPSVAEAIESVAAQDLPSGVSFRLIVCDNDLEPSAREIVETTARRLGLDFLYVHAPAQNISLARNACLKTADAPFLAFLDDDETADRLWLRKLLERQAADGADVVFGAVRAVYGAGLPAWVARADLHSTPSPVRRDGTIVSGYAGSVLMRRGMVGDLTFDLALGRTGGEDTFFFHELGRRGARFAFNPEAVADEPVTPGRARLPWLLKRSFRAGQTHAGLMLEEGANRLVKAGLAVAKVAFCVADAALHALSPPAWRRRLVRAALHAGVISRLAGYGEIKLY